MLEISLPRYYSRYLFEIKIYTSWNLCLRTRTLTLYLSLFFCCFIFVQIIIPFLSNFASLYSSFSFVFRNCLSISHRFIIPNFFILFRMKNETCRDFAHAHENSNKFSNRTPNRWTFWIFLRENFEQLKNTGDFFLYSFQLNWFTMMMKEIV